MYLNEHEFVYVVNTCQPFCSGLSLNVLNEILVQYQTPMEFKKAYEMENLGAHKTTYLTIYG